MFLGYKSIKIILCGQIISVHKACESSIFLFHRQFSFRDKGQKERCETTLLSHLGIAKHLHHYNSEAHTRRCKHSLSTVE